MITRTLAMAVMMGTLAASTALAQSTTTQPQTPAVTATTPAFLSQAQPGDWRASKLVGVDIYGVDNKSIGSVSDVLINKDGSIKAVVIGVGGFLGVGEKNVAVPFSAINWMDAPPVSASGNTTTDTTGSITPPTPGAPAVAPATTMRGVYDYPDHGVLRMTKDQLQNAPTFSYASEQK